MRNFGQRIKKERERLGFTQAMFAKACGVGRTAQFNYERGEREPSMSYIAAAERLGVDATYIITGIGLAIPSRTEAGGASVRKLNLTRAAMVIQEAMGEAYGPETYEWLAKRYPDGIYEDVLEQGIRSWKSENTNTTQVDPGNKVLSTELVLPLLLELDSALLQAVLEGVEKELSSQQQMLSPRKKARTVAMLYRTFKASGGVDPVVLADAVKLAVD
jgi:transcriptional regulator with XRE-family HTH domain